MRKTEHHTIEGNRKTKNSIKRLFFCLLAIFLQIAFFLSIMNHLNTQMPWINECTDQNSCFNSCFIHLQQK